MPSTAGKLAFLAVTSTSVIGATAPLAAAATPPPPTVSVSLGAGWGGSDGNSDLTITADPAASRPLPVEVGYAASVPGNQGQTLVRDDFDCGQGQHFGGPVSASMDTGYSGAGTCTYNAPGVYTVTYTVTDNENPAQSASASHTLTIVAPPQVPVDRYDGASRYGTGVAVSQAAFPAAGSADAVVLARGDVFADALAGIPLAKDKNGPLLLTPGGPDVTALDPNVQAELLRVLTAGKNHTVFVLGGTDAIPQAVADAVSGLGYNVVRLSGSSRFGTALDIAEDPRALDNPQRVVVARGDDFADALAAGPFASNAGKDADGVPAAILLSDGAGTAASPATLDSDTAAYVSARITAGPANVYAIGGGAAKAVAALPGSAGFQQVVGADRFITAADLVNRDWDGFERANPLGVTTIGVVNGFSFPDALTGGAYMALKGAPLLLTNTTNGLSSPVVLQVGHSPILAEVDVFGGPAVIPTTLTDQMLQSLGSDRSRYIDHHVAF